MLSSTVVHNNLHFNQEVDPTRTKTLRDRFATEMRRRFNIIQSLIRHAIVDKDVFGLSPVTLITKEQAMERIQVRQFAFGTSARKVEAFTDWLEEMNKQFILSGGVRGAQVIRLPGTLPGVREAWTDTYIHSAYQKGILRARTEMVKAGYDVPSLIPGDTDALQAAFNLPIHADRVGLLSTRSFSELKGITATMDQQISRVLSQGMADGKNPRELARLLTKTITGPVGDLGITDTLGRFIPARRRAELLARTEIIRSHHVATINEYRHWEVEGVRVRAEWQTAGDHRVCGDCASLQGKVFKLEEIENMIPLHPLCRCIALPLEVKPTRPVEEGVISEELLEERRQALIRAELELKQAQKARKGVFDAVTIRDDAKIRYVTSLKQVKPEMYLEERKEIIEKIVKKPRSLSPRQFSSSMKKVIQGFDYVPYDVLYGLERQGLRITFERNVRPYYFGPDNKIVLDFKGRFDTIAHEIGHAIDDMVMNRRFDGVEVPFKDSGLLGRGNIYVSKDKIEELRAEFRSLSSGKTARYKNGDGTYWKNNWLDNYEGRIYTSGSPRALGDEWWASNCQRYSVYRQRLLEFDKKLKSAKAEWEAAERGTRTTAEYKRRMKEKYEKLKAKGAEGYAAELSKWDKARERYPKLTNFIEESFSGPTMRKDVAP